MNIQQRISEEVEDLSHHHHIIKITQINTHQYLLIYSPKQIQCAYSQRKFRIKLVIPDKYPDAPPYLTFLDYIYHLNISPTTGEVRMTVVEDDWSPFLSLTSVIESLDRVLEQPEEEYPADSDILFLFKHKKSDYIKKTKLSSFTTSLRNQSLSETEIVSPEKVIVDSREIEINQNLQVLQKQFDDFTQKIPEIQSQEQRYPEKLIQIQNMPVNSQKEGVVIMSQKRKTNTESPTHAHKKDRQPHKQSKQSPPRVLRINQMISIFIEQLNQLEKQIQLSNNQQIQQILKNARDKHIELLKQLLIMSEQAKKNALEILKKQISNI